MQRLVAGGLEGILGLYVEKHLSVLWKKSRGPATFSVRVLVLLLLVLDSWIEGTGRVRCLTCADQYGLEVDM